MCQKTLASIEADAREVFLFIFFLLTFPPPKKKLEIPVFIWNCACKNRNKKDKFIGNLNVPFIVCI